MYLFCCSSRFVVLLNRTVVIWVRLGDLLTDHWKCVCLCWKPLKLEVAALTFSKVRFFNHGFLILWRITHGPNITAENWKAVRRNRVFFKFIHPPAAVIKSGVWCSTGTYQSTKHFRRKSGKMMSSTSARGIVTALIFILPDSIKWLFINFVTT
jgi:hypothetical protein